MARIEYEIIRSNRKTLGLEVKTDGRVVVRAPMRTTKREIEEFVSSHRDWIESKRAKMAARSKSLGSIKPLTEKEVKDLKAQAKKVFPKRVAHFATLIGVDYGRISIRMQKSRWGSCTSEGNLNFNCLLMLAPSEVLDSVVVHELCHRKHMNHSKGFYDEILRVCPDYKKHQKWLKDHGPELMRRIPR